MKHHEVVVDLGWRGVVESRGIMWPSSDCTVSRWFLPRGLAVWGMPNWLITISEIFDGSLGRRPRCDHVSKRIVAIHGGK
jgi:hypothetical protein